VQTTVIRETRIPDASSGVVYVNEAGLIVQAPVTTTTVQKSVENGSTGDGVFADRSSR
jgi:hypothetical protein